MHSTNMPDFAEITRQAERDGLWVLPACQDPSQKHPSVPWKHLQERRPTHNEISEWIRRYPNRNGVYLTGPILGRFVFDLDNPEAIAWAADQGIPRTQVARTRKGYHVHFRYPDFRVYNSVCEIHAGADIRGFGGVAVAVGSVHESGFRYAWVKGRSPQGVALVDAPDWLLEWLRIEANRRVAVQANHAAPKPFTGKVTTWARRAVDAELRQLSSTGEGQRNHAIARAAFKLGQLAGGGEVDLPEVRDALYQVAEAWPNFEKSRKTIESCLAVGMAYPRRRQAA